MKPLMIILASILCSFSLAGQNPLPERRCAWEHILAAKEKNESQHLHHDPNDGQPLTPASPTSSVITIPVVFHVIHDGKPLGVEENIATDLIYAQLQQLNDDFRRQNADRNQTPSIFLPFAADVEVDFCLAQRDTAGFPTTGILRYNFGVAEYTPDQFKHIVQSRTTWNRDKYLNIWIADLTGYLGYAYLPGGEAIGDGLVVDYITVGSLSQPNPRNTPFKYGRTATHEIGHWLGLDHHWARPQDCFTDDGVQDTPLQYNYYVGKPRHPSTSCGNTDMFMNFLDYVDDDAMNLYTQGQKSVMRSTLYTTRSGLLSSNACLPPDPILMFDMGEFTAVEGTGDCGTNGDLIIPVTMKIAAAPSRTATVNLSTSGNAQNGQDFTLSTSSLQFPAGSLSSRTFEVRISKDAYIEQVKDLKISYSLSSGGGNARKGTMHQDIFGMLVDDDFEATPYEMMEEDLGQNMGSATTASPFRGRFTDGRTQAIYTAAELSSMGLTSGFIHSISYYVTSKNSTTPFRNFHLKLALSNKHQYGIYPHFYPSGTTVYSGDLFTVAGKMKIDLTTPFYWDGYSNLVVSTCYDNPGASNDDQVRFENTSQAPKALSEFLNGGNGCSNDFMPVAHGLRPVIALEVAVGAEVAMEENSGSGYAECDFGSNSSVYFYEESQGKVMMALENSTFHDYGCTRVEIDRDGLGAVNLWGTSYQSTGKTFLISPDHPDPSGNVEVSLYYSMEEIESWEQQNTLGNDRTQLKLTVCSSSIDRSQGSQCESYTPEIISYGNDLIFRANVPQGFAGLTLSNWTGGFLAVSGLTLEGKKEDNKVVLHTSPIGSWSAGDMIELEYLCPHDDTWISLDKAKAERMVLQTYRLPHGCPSITYRAKLYSTDGSMIFSNTVDIENEENWRIEYTDGEARLFNGHERSEFRLMTLTGQLVEGWVQPPFESKAVFRSDLSRGAYLLTGLNTNGVRTETVVLMY